MGLFTYSINATFRIKHAPKVWKHDKVIMILNPGKAPKIFTSYRPISLLTMMSKVFKKFLLKRIYSIIEVKQLLPDIQFGFRADYSTIQQIQSVPMIVLQVLEVKKYFPAMFLDTSQASDKVEHNGLLHKLHKHFPRAYCQIIK